MPYVKSIPLHATISRAIAYILNPDKTEDLLYTTSLNCLTNAKGAYLAMKSVYEHYSGKKFNAPLPVEGKGSVKAIHYIQSFDPQDNVPPELAHRIAKAFARKAFGDKCQVVIATHNDKQHTHNHIIINCYSLTGQKFNDNQNTLKNLREISDRVCLAFGIQPIPDREEQSRNIAYNEWEHRRRGTSWKEKIRIDIDRLIDKVKNIDELLYELELQGYEIKRGKYISLKAEGQQRFVRTKTLGEDYTVDSLISRILWRDVGAGVSLDDDATAPIQEDYRCAINDISQLARTGKKVQRRRDTSAPYSPDNDLDVYKLSAQLSIINRDNIHSIGELEGKIQCLKSECEKARQEINQLISKQEHLNTLLEQANIYFSLADKSDLSPAEQLKLTIARTTVRNGNIQSHNDYDRLKSEQAEIDKKIAVFKNNFKNCENVYRVYADIADTYYKISEGDYVSKLIKEQRKRESKHINNTVHKNKINQITAYHYNFKTPH